MKNLPTLTKEERTLFDSFKLAEAPKEALEQSLEKIKELCLQEDPFEAARLKWLWLAYGLEEGWLSKNESSAQIIPIDSSGLGYGLSFESASENSKFCQLVKKMCSGCDFKAYAGAGCNLVWDFWLYRNEPLPVLEAVLEASMDKELANAQEACQPWEVMRKSGTLGQLEKVWKPTPWIVSLKTDRNAEGASLHESFTKALSEILGEESSKLNPNANWQEGIVSVHGWVWFGFRTEGMMFEAKKIYESFGGKYE